MKKLNALKAAKTKPDLANLLNIKPTVFTHCLYVIKTENQYKQFKIPKKTGGERTINAPTGTLKNIQSSLSELLLDCLDEINKTKFPDSEPSTKPSEITKILKIKIPNRKTKQPSLSHGFERKRSIITNAMMHLGRNNVLNIDLENYFSSFNFGRVRGFFIKNRDFSLDPEIATVIAKIACHKNELPQGSPCSPVITNLILHSLDIKLARLASINSCTYTRYADDITFSTREKIIPAQIAYQKEDSHIVGKKLRNEIKRAGFSINNKKTRNQYFDSRQDVTGLVVNKKPNTKKEYWRTVRAQCNSLFHNGIFTEKVNGETSEGNINKLEGKLNFIDQVDHYNRVRQTIPLNPKYQTKVEALKKGSSKSRRYLHSGREKTFSRFLFYQYFYGNISPTILTEGKTDNVYIKAAIHMLAGSYPQLATAKTSSSEYKLLMRFIEYSPRTRYLLELFGGADYLKDFVINYSKNCNYYKAPKPSKPVIIVVDNDTGPNGPKSLISYVNKIKGAERFPSSATNANTAEFIHIFHNLYLVLTPRGTSNSDTDIEYFFKDSDRLRFYNGRCFNTVASRDPQNDLSKEAFATHVIHKNKNSVDFSGFTDILNRISMVLRHYESIK